MTTAPTDDAQPLAQNRDFKVLLGSQGISALGDAVSFTALPGLQPIGLLVGGLVIDATSGSTTMALMGICMILISLGCATIGSMRGATATIVSS